MKMRTLFITLAAGGGTVIILSVLLFRSAGSIPFVAAFNGSSSASGPIRFMDFFERKEAIKEAGTMAESGSADWWVNSGAYLYVNGGEAETVHGNLPADDPRRIQYANTNPDETDNGYHPQNIFRLVTRTTWGDFEQQAYSKLDAYILSQSPHRFEANGILLFNRYLDGDNLYYAGLRVDGFAVVKKKIRGEYYTIAEKRILPGTYDRTSNPNLIPVGTWIGLKTNVRTEADGTVSIALSTDIGKTGTWTAAIETKDDGRSFGGAPILDAGHAGIRTDFMDVRFAEYSIGKK